MTIYFPERAVGIIPSYSGHAAGGGGPPVGAPVFFDNAVEGVNTALSSHTPDVGTGYTQQMLVGAGALRVVAATHAITAAIGGSSRGSLYTADAPSWGNDQYIELYCLNSGSSDDPIIVSVRYTDTTHHYVWRFNASGSDVWYRDGSTTYVQVGGAMTAIPDSSIVAMEIVGTTIKLYLNYVEIESETDATHSSGAVGIGIGSIAAFAPFIGNDASSQSIGTVRAGSTSYLDSFQTADTFAEVGDTALDSHTPNVGTGWTLAHQLLSVVMAVSGGNNWVKATTGPLNGGVIYTADAAIGSADYRVGSRLTHSHSNYNPFLFARYQDSNNYYCIEKDTNTLARIYKNVAGVFTQVGSDFTMLSGTNFIELEVEGNDLRAYVNGMLKTSGTATDHTTEGKAGIGEGALRTTPAYTSGTAFENFRVIAL